MGAETVHYSLRASSAPSIIQSDLRTVIEMFAAAGCYWLLMKQVTWCLELAMAQKEGAKRRVKMLKRPSIHFWCVGGHGRNFGRSHPLYLELGGSQSRLGLTRNGVMKEELQWVRLKHRQVHQRSTAYCSRKYRWRNGELMTPDDGRRGRLRQTADAVGGGPTTRRCGGSAPVDGRRRGQGARGGCDGHDEL